MKNQILSIIKNHTFQDRIKGKVIVKELKNRYDIIAEESQIRTGVNELRIEKYPIGSDGAGYFYALDDRELEHTIAQMTSRVDKMMQAVRGLNKCFEKKGQLKMELK